MNWLKELFHVHNWEIKSIHSGDEAVGKYHNQVIELSKCNCGKTLIQRRNPDGTIRFRLIQ